MECGSSSGGGEVRKVHIIYFLSRSGSIEHPHLIRVHHLSRTGVYLRDVKRWLADLRGKEMPEAFAWSYKRRYKNGYVWQDLSEDDLITPISDNEYVLKGSEIIHCAPLGCSSYKEKKACAPRKDAAESKESMRAIFDASRKSASGNHEDSLTLSSERSSVTDDSTGNEEETSMLNKHNGEQSKSSQNVSSSSLYQTLFGKSKKRHEKTENSSSGRPSTSSSSSSRVFSRSKSYSGGGASQVFRSLITCGGVDTNDSAIVTLNQSDDSQARISNGGKMGTSTRVLGTIWNDEHQLQRRYSARKSFDGLRSGVRKNKEKTGFCSAKVTSVADKPSFGPICSQCGKSFRPEKMHSHMKACRGMRVSAKQAAASNEKTPLKQEDHSPQRENYV